MENNIDKKNLFGKQIILTNGQKATLKDPEELYDFNLKNKKICLIYKSNIQYTGFFKEVDLINDNIILGLSEEDSDKDQKFPLDGTLVCWFLVEN